MPTNAQQLGTRIREIRRRHFGARGKAEFAARLALAVDEYEKIERGSVPGGEVLLKICEVTGEDLQWLLTGVASRSTVVIGGVRSRHQVLLTRIAQTLDDTPELAGPLEAFVELLTRGAALAPADADALPAPSDDPLIPIVELADLPDTPPDAVLAPGAAAMAVGDGGASAPFRRAVLIEPALAYRDEPEAAEQSIEVLGGSDAPRFLRHAALRRALPDACATRIADDAMSPMFQSGDVVVFGASAASRIGQPAVCRFADAARNRCRIWLGESENQVRLGCLTADNPETLERDALRWSRDVVYRVPRPA